MTAQVQTAAFIPSTHFITSDDVGKISLGHNGRDFFVLDSKNLKSDISKVNLSKELRGITLEGLEKVLSVGYLAVSKVGEEHAVRLNVRMAGGGPLFGLLAGAGTVVAGAALMTIGFITTPVGGAPLVLAGGVLIGQAPVVVVVASGTPTL